MTHMFRSRDPSKVKMAYTPDSIWRNRDTFIRGRDQIEGFLTDKWNREHEYKLRKELFAFDNDKVSQVSHFRSQHHSSVRFLM
jgi:uncharacterized protein